MPGSRLGFVLSVLTCMVLLLGGCDSGSSSGTSTSSSSSSSSSTSTSSSGFVRANVQVHFPPPVTKTDAASITVRGTVADTADVTQVFVDGNPVTSSNALADWQLTVTLAEGLNSLPITYQNSAGQIVAAGSVTVEQETALISPRRLVHDEANNRLLVLDISVGGIISVNATNGARRLLAPGSGTGLIANPWTLALDSANNELLVAQNADTQFVRVALADGSQTAGVEQPLPDIELNNLLLPMSFIGNGTYALADRETLFVNSNNELVDKTTEGAIEVNRSLLYSYNPVTGVKALITRFDTPTTDLALQDVIDLASTADSEFIYVLDTFLGTNGTPIFRVVRVAKATGERALILPAFDSNDQLIADSHILVQPTQLRLDPTGSSLWLLDNNQLVQVDLTTRKGAVISGEEVPADGAYNLANVADMEIDTSGSVVFTVNDTLNRVMQVAAATGERTIISTTVAEDGDALATPTGLALDSANSKVYVADGAAGLLAAIDLATGERTVVLKRVDADGDGNLDTPVNFPLKLALGNNRLYVQDNFNQLQGLGNAFASAPRIYAVNLADVSTQILRLHNSTFQRLLDLAVDTNTNALYSAELLTFASPPDYIAKFDLNADPLTLNLLSAATTPNSVNQFNSLRALAWDSTHGRLLAADAGNNAIIAVDTDTGARTILSGPGLPATSTDELQTPMAITVDAANDRALVLDSAQRAVLEVNLTTGERGTVITHPVFANSESFVYFAELGYLIVANDQRDEISAIDLVTQQKVVLSY